MYALLMKELNSSIDEFTRTLDILYALRRPTLTDTCQHPTYAGYLRSRLRKRMKMDQQFHPKLLAEKLIEFVYTRQQLGFSKDLSPATLNNMAWLDVDALENDRGGISSVLDIDWNTALASLEQDTHIEAATLSVSQALLMQDESNLQHYKSIEAHLDEEFTPSPLITEEQWQKENLFIKAYAIAVQRAKNDFIHVTRPADYKDNKMKYEFHIYLRMLQGGNGRHYQSTKLYFSYNVPFYSFLRALQDATQLCVIPPRRIHVDISSSQEAGAKITGAKAEPRTLEPGLSRDDRQEAVGSFDQQISSPLSSSRTVPVFLHDESSSNDSVTCLGPVDPVMAPQKIQATKSPPTLKVTTLNESRRAYPGRDRGYTLEDGPWSYLVVNIASPLSRRIWQRLSDTDEYAGMLETIKWHVRAHPKDEIVAIIMHSLDVEAYEEFMAHSLQESFRPQNEAPPGWDETLDDVDDEGEGEPYFQWLSRNWSSENT